ncbi:reverse transcriptase N-terminal domain-containing protein [Anabaena sp. AL93]|uniref:reverse transcriptase N-terminal domain-containing protein n=1 Tax=Anabaena sp. AL93 TaxID=1678133 RepID=UPI000AB471AE|nr:reverse transcriptase N-terminal domain-containing protein [Anabaena sp. AL93]MCX5981032.1 reverse transcriptase N-terminal domain-containing protein [Nostocales cyanobacterium LacPavin_0920_SED1_MAG_38_18]
MNKPKSDSTLNTEGWKTINWRQVERYVFKLQKRIYAASRCGDIKRVRFPPENPNEVLVEQGISGKKGNTRQPGKKDRRSGWYQITIPRSAF